MENTGFTSKQIKCFIMEIQNYLYAISYHNDRIPHIIPDGFYGPETAQAVKVFQIIYNITPTGETDAKTWNKIVSVYRSYQKPKPLNVFYDGLELSKNSQKDILYITQVLLDRLSDEYANVPKPNINGEYCPKMEKAVEGFLKVCGSEKNSDEGKFGKNEWDILAGEFNAEHKRDV